MTGSLRRWLADETGASAVELALLLTPLVLLVFGAVHLCLMMYSATQLNFATEATARCMVTAQNAYANGSYTDTCYNATGTTSATSYFTAVYHGATPAPTLTLDESQTCNSTTSFQVVATTNYVINAGLVKKTVPLTAKACFPHT